VSTVTAGPVGQSGAPTGRPSRRVLVILLVLSALLNFCFLASPRHRHRTRTEKMHEQVAPLIGAAWEEIAKPQADAAQVMRLFDEAAEKRREFQREATAKTLDFLAILTPAQRGKFVAIAHQRRAPWLRRH